MLYKGDHLREISFPLGGIGTGCIGLGGNGMLIDWEIFNHPSKGEENGYSFFAVRAEYPDGRAVCKILQGDKVRDLSGSPKKSRFTGFGFGPSSSSMAGYPHFKRVSFDGKFPIATLTFEDDSFPARVVMKAYNPFIPLDSEASSLPLAAFDIKIISRESGIKYSVYLSLTNNYEKTQNKKIESKRYTAVKLARVGVNEGEVAFGDLCAALAEPDGLVTEYWYRGGWQDKASTFWHELTNGQMHERTYAEPGFADTATIGSTHTIDRRASHTWSFVISWSFPNSNAGGCSRKDANGERIVFKNYYATVFKSSKESAFYYLKNRKKLFRKTDLFTKTLHGSTLDPAVIDALSSTLSVLKSPTVLRLEDGTFWGWEGVHEYAGSCEGTCTHVWNYAYALPFLFPDLERSIRDTEFNIDTNSDGEMRFRTPLPPTPYVGNGTTPCLDGQMGSVIKAYREWKISGNSEWLAANYKKIKATIDYATSDKNPWEWDKDNDGVLEGRQHHTLDMELFGPSSWLEGMYLAALLAAERIAEFMNDGESAKKYRALFESGYAWTRDNLFNGEYFIHKIDILDRSYTEHFSCPQYWNEEKGQLKYQIADGCSIDQMLGEWHAHICGLGNVFSPEQKKVALKNAYRNLYKPSMREFANVWRVYVLNDEAGTIMCDYPKGCIRPVIPIPYVDECMTGFEYSFAGLLIAEGFIEEGLSVVRAVRDRYDGKKRNPYNEIECGSNYARAMASYALLPIFSGFTFDLPRGRIGFRPILDGDFRSFFSIGTAWGEYERRGGEEFIRILDGKLTLSELSISSAGAASLTVDGKKIPFEANGERLKFDTVTAYSEIKVTRS